MLAVAGAALAGVIALGAPEADAAGVTANAGSIRIETAVTSLRARRDAGVVRQRHDFSCGAAALATLLTYALNDPVDEAWMLRALLAPLAEGELVTLQHKGLSLIELQRLAELRGHRAQAFRVPADQLVKLARPVIVFIRPGRYDHFAVFKGVRGDQVRLADPSLGNVRMPMYRFRDMWVDASGRGVVFAIEPKDGIWPGHYALQLDPAPANAPEWAAVERLATRATPFPLITPGR